jgi:hypothetical protein
MHVGTFGAIMEDMNSHQFFGLSAGHIAPDHTLTLEVREEAEIDHKMELELTPRSYPFFRSSNVPPRPHHSKSIQDSIRVNLKPRRTKEAGETQ